MMTTDAPCQPSSDTPRVASHVIKFSVTDMSYVSPEKPQMYLPRIKTVSCKLLLLEQEYTAVY